MKEEGNPFLPIATHNTREENEGAQDETQAKIIGNSPCPCCGFITIPNQGDASAFICPVCFWEIDLFIKFDNESSDQNHGLTLSQGRGNFTTFGAILPCLKKDCREPRNWELPRKEE